MTDAPQTDKGKTPTPDKGTRPGGSTPSPGGADTDIDSSTGTPSNTPDSKPDGE